MNCRSCGIPFSCARYGDTNTLCPPCRRPTPPEPIGRVGYLAPGYEEYPVLTQKDLDNCDEG